jgi:hypothetical protein
VFVDVVGTQPIFLEEAAAGSLSDPPNRTNSVKITQTIEDLTKDCQGAGKIFLWILLAREHRSSELNRDLLDEPVADVYDHGQR